MRVGLGHGEVLSYHTLLYEGMGLDLRASGRIQLEKGFPPRRAGEFNLKKVWQRVLRNGAYDEVTRACTILLCL